jgi:hypothetical protein
MAVKKNVKGIPETSLRKPLISDELAFRIMNIAGQTGISPPDIILKWVLQEESWIGLNKISKGEAKQSKMAVDKTVQKSKNGKDVSSAHNKPIKFNALLTLKTAVALKKKGMSHKKIADSFNEKNIPTVSGTGKWYASSVSNLLKPKK